MSRREELKKEREENKTSEYDPEVVITTLRNKVKEMEDELDRLNGIIDILNERAQ